MTQALSPADRRDWLRLARTENVGPVTFDQLIGRFGDPGRALAALPDLARRGGRMASLGVPDPAVIDAELAAGEALGARLICGCEADFPQGLAALDPPPPVLWAWGDVALLSKPAVAIVGARVASAAGQRFARGLAAELGQSDLVVISGMARGIDGAAHEGAISTGTVAVLGGGVNDIYPSDHADLHRRIVEGGCVVSENEPGRTAVARDFPRRNRIIAGLSRAVVVVEAEMRSGSLITARLAAEQGRDVLAVPGSPLDPRAKGTNDLIRQGAALCEGPEDVLRVLEGFRDFREPDRRFEALGDLPDPDDALREKVAALLSPTPVSRDEIVRATNAPAPAVFAALMELSLAGRCEMLSGGMVARG